MECNTREKSFLKYWILIKQFWKMRKQFHVMVVGFPGHPVMPLAWVLAKFFRKKIVFDAFISLYDSFVFDEKKFSRYSFSAYKYWLLDWVSCHMADVVLLEVNEYAKYFQETFGITPNKFQRLLVTCDDEIMYPREKIQSKNFVIHFHGTYIPAQGIEYILGAAKILRDQDISFNIIGRLKDYEPVIKKAKNEGLVNVNFFDFMPYEQLAVMMAQADLCLGMFGDTDKAKRAGAFKIMEAMAMGKPLLTGDTLAVREFLVDRENSLLCNIADSQDLAEKILELKNNKNLREKIATKGHQDFQKSMTPKKIGAELKQIFQTLD